ncbi:MAG: addiction module protein [Verrucomicrobiota bacterium]
MIKEMIPDLERLSVEQKRELAKELIIEVEGIEKVEIAPAILDALEERVREHEVNPESGSTWAEVKERVFGKNAS